MKAARLVLRVVDGRSQESHLVGIEVAAMYRRSGRYPALCGVEVYAASLTTAASRHCRMCQAQAEGSQNGIKRRRGIDFFRRG